MTNITSNYNALNITQNQNPLNTPPPFQIFTKEVKEIGKVTISIAFGIIIFNAMTHEPIPTFKRAVYEVFLGVSSGVVNAISISALCIILSPFIKNTMNPSKTEDYQAFCTGLSTTGIIRSAAVEEIVFRGCIQPILNQTVLQLFPTQKASSHLISLIASSVLFGIAHYTNFNSVNQVALATLQGIIFGELKHKSGLISVIAAHATSNLTVSSIIRYSEATIEALISQDNQDKEFKDSMAKLNKEFDDWAAKRKESRDLFFKKLDDSSAKLIRIENTRLRMSSLRKRGENGLAICEK